MINLEKQIVKHNTFGIGEIIEQTDTHILVAFPEQGVVKKFVFPDAFKAYLECMETDLQNLLFKIATDKDKQLEDKKIERQKEAKKLLESYEETKSGLLKKKPFKKENIPFKCNYCDGGEKINGIGYIQACSDKMIKYNVVEATHAWCSDSDSPCRQYLRCQISRKTLDSYAENGGFVCYESQMLRNWTAYAGNILNGKNRDKTKKLSKVQVNSLAILTTREPGMGEKNRIVFGVFLIDEAFEGDACAEGHVMTTSKYKLGLTKKEARKIKFWNYYRNEKAPESISWGQGLHRYISDMQAASILKDILEVKRGTSDEELADEFLKVFCSLNGINLQLLPVREGALKVKK